MTLTQRLDAWRERRGRLRAIDGVSPEEIADCGLSPSQFRDLVLMPSEQVARMEEMARVNGLDPVRLARDRDLQVEVALTCVHCDEQSRCRDVLSRKPSRAATDFCPNAGTYRKLAAE